jgi:hypothetical protein
VPDIIDFLERLGQDSGLRHATDGEIRAALAGVGIDPAVGAAVAAGDERELRMLLSARRDVCCLIFVPVREDEEEEEQPDEPQKDDTPKSQQRRVA